MLQYLASVALFAQPTSALPGGDLPLPKGDEILARFDNGEIVTRKQFERVYLAHHPGQGLRKADASTVREYLTVYIHARQKVFQARALGLDSAAGFKEELGGYIRQLAQSYLIETEVLNWLVNEAMERSKYEIRANHILIEVKPSAPPEDTLKAYRKAMALRDSVTNGYRSFMQMATRYSEDPSTRNSGGELGFFGVLDMVYPFETGAYTTPPGSISLPIRSSFGYHIIWVRDRIPNQGVRRTAQIVVLHNRPAANDTSRKPGLRDTVASFQRIAQLHARLRNGERFSDLASCCSEDESTRPVSGDLGTGRLLPALEEAKHFLVPNEYTQPIYSQYGWHILKLTQMSQHPGTEQTRNQLKQRITQNERVEVAKKRLVTSLRKSYGFVPNLAGEKSLLDAYAELATSTPTGWKRILQSIEKESLFSFSNKQVTIAEFVSHYAATPLLKLQSHDHLYRLLDAFTDFVLLQHAEQQLPITSSRFRELSEEYHDGLLLFAVMEKEVWRPAIEDSSGLRKYFELNRATFEQGSQPDGALPQHTFDVARADIVAAYQKSLEKSWLEKLERLFPVTIYEKIFQKLFK